MGQDQALGLVPFIPRQHRCPEDSDGGARGSWGSLKAAVSPCEDPSVSQGQYDLC